MSSSTQVTPSIGDWPRLLIALMSVSRLGPGWGRQASGSLSPTDGAGSGSGRSESRLTGDGAGSRSMGKGASAAGVAEYGRGDGEGVAWGRARSGGEGGEK
jgi:hypothetical protein